MLCRLCIFECSADDGFDIFSNVKEPDLEKLIQKYLCLEIPKNDDISTNICNSCLERLKEFDDFFDFVQRRQKCLEAVYLENDDAEAEFLENFSKEIEQENPLAEFDETNVGEVMPEPWNISDITNNDSTCGTEDAISAITSFKKEVAAEKDKDIDINLQHCAEKLEHPKVNTTKFKSFNVRSNIAPSQSDITDERDKFIEEHVQLKCKICRAVLDTFKNFQRHFRIKHKCPAYIKCCGSRFYSRQRMIKHIQLHVNPELYKCHICNKNLSSRKNLESHMASFHTEKEKLQNVCEICGDRFTTPFILRTHMIVHEEGNNYICEICDKSFKHLRSVKRHKRLQHGNKLNHVCELCGKNYKYKQIFEQHMADKHNIISKDTMKYCEECKVWFSTKYYQKHAERHKFKEVECKYCGKIYPSIAALSKHADSHYHKKKCSTCGSTFNSAKDFREHMETHAS